MSRVVIVARTRMSGDDLCIGGHDLDARFRGVRLLDWYGGHWQTDCPFMVGEIWDIDYQPKISARPPHVEDVIVRDHRPAGRAPDLPALVLRHRRPWAGPPEALFDGTLRATQSGVAYIPVKGQLPRCSTGYWQPSEPLARISHPTHIRFSIGGDGAIKRITWVGTQSPPEKIEPGSLVRVSLSRAFKSDAAPEGYYLQLSGIIS